MKSLKCFDRISVRLGRLKRRSTEVIYSLEFDGLRKEYRLINAYPEDLPEKGLSEAAALAGIVPAVNYGLFTDEINLDLPLHELDYKFFVDMMRITARDIFVNRILARTGLIKEEYVPDPSEVTPEDAEPRAFVSVRETFTGTEIEHEPQRGKCAVMSSGGKESLLAYGLLKELGCNVYPFFLNESGRHWFTALTAYRELSRVDPNTRKVWSTVDRLFAFIEKNLKIVVPNYWRRNREIYPVRLFWYAHYILSFIPLIVKHGLGDVVMGNEFDDTALLSFEYKGIRHYNAAYDQSLDFDRYMTGWYRERGLNLRQWSPLRPISPLIVIRILFNRYPELARLQTSCHSTRIVNGVVKPCGVCFKCNGVMLMLLAEGVDPRVIRYEERHVATLPDRVLKGMLRLEESIVEHSLFKIAQRGLWSLQGARPHWHVETIHFDSVNSPPDFVPDRELRLRVLGIFEKYTTGYTKLVGSSWVPLTEEEIRQIKELS